MKANKMSKSIIAAGVLGALTSVSSLAADTTMTFAFTTVPDVSIAEFQAMSFGNDFTLSSGDACTLLVNVAGTEQPASIDARLGLAATVAAGTSFEAKTGNCDTVNPGTAGIYTITGAAGVEVNITVNAIPAGGVDFSYIPTGCVVDYDGSASGDTCAAFTPAGNNLTASVDLASAADTGATGSPIPGQAYIFLGGTITAETALLAGSSLSESFTIDVIY